MHELILPFINLFILVGVIVYYTRQPIGQFVSGRHAFYRDEVKRVEEQLTHSRERLEEFTSKLKAIDAEVSALKNQARAEGEASRVRITHEAQKLATTIVSDSRASAQALFDDLKSQLRTEFGVKVIERAEQVLRERLTGDDRARIRKEFSTQVAAGLSRESA